MTPSPEDRARLVIPSEPTRIAEVDEFLEAVLREHGIPETDVSDIAIATTELVNNAILHGNKKDASKCVAVSVEISTGEVVIRVVDEGEGFDPSTLPDPLADENLLKEVGRGIFIARSLMDDLTYEHPSEGGTAVILRKSRNPS